MFGPSAHYSRAGCRLEPRASLTVVCGPANPPQRRRVGIVVVLPGRDHHPVATIAYTSTHINVSNVTHCWLLRLHCYSASSHTPAVYEWLSRRRGIVIPSSVVVRIPVATILIVAGGAYFLFLCVTILLQLILACRLTHTRLMPLVAVATSRRHCRGNHHPSGRDYCLYSTHIKTCLMLRIAGCST